MTDTEIFIDAISTKRFNGLNSSLDDVIQKIISQNPNIEIDDVLRTLSAA